jgi:hypothetical protein
MNRQKFRRLHESVGKAVELALSPDSETRIAPGPDQTELAIRFVLTHLGLDQPEVSEENRSLACGMVVNELQLRDILEGKDTDSRPLSRLRRVQADEAAAATAQWHEQTE